jgi:hypothetical protein
MKFAPSGARPVPSSVKLNPQAATVEKASVTLSEEGMLDITAEPGETVSLRPDPMNGDLSEVVVVDADGNEETIALPEAGATAYSSTDPNKPIEEQPMAEEAVPVSTP